MRRSIRKRLSTSEPTTAPSLSRRGAPAANACGASCRREFILSGQPTSLESHSWRIPQPARRRSRRPPRRPERQQILLRRGLALGGGLLLLILIVLGVKGCLDARKHRALSDYARNVTQIVEETDQTSKALLRQARRPRRPLGDRVRRPRSTPTAARWTTTRAASTASSAPGDMSNAQNALELVYELRASAMDEIAEQMSTALGDVGAEKATAAIASQMQKLLASDVLYADRGPARDRRRPRRQRDRRRRRAEERLPAGRHQVARRKRRSSAALGSVSGATERRNRRQSTASA